MFCSPPFQHYSSTFKYISDKLFLVLFARLSCSCNSHHFVPSLKWCPVTKKQQCTLATSILEFQGCSDNKSSKTQNIVESIREAPWAISFLAASLWLLKRILSLACVQHMNAKACRQNKRIKKHFCFPTLSSTIYERKGCRMSLKEQWCLLCCGLQVFPILKGCKLMANKSYW